MNLGSPSDDPVRVLDHALTPVIDLLALAGCLCLTPMIAGRFRTHTVWNAAWVGGAYILLCVGIYVCRKLEAGPARGGPAAGGGPSASGGRAPANAFRPSAFVVWLSWPYAAFVAVMIADTAGAFERGSALWEKLTPAGRGAGPGSFPLLVLFMGILVLYPLLLVVPSRPTIRRGTWAYRWWRSAGVGAADVMVVVTAAYWEGELAGAEPMDMAWAGRILVFVLGYAVFLMFYAPPRLALLSLEPDRRSFIGYALLLGYTVWRFM